MVSEDRVLILKPRGMGIWCTKTEQSLKRMHKFQSLSPNYGDWKSQGTLIYRSCGNVRRTRPSLFISFFSVY